MKNPISRGLKNKANKKEKDSTMPGPRILEKYIEQYATNRAKTHGWFTRKLSWIGCDSAPDRIFAKDGFVIFVEFKRPGEELRDAQEWEHREMKKYGINVVRIDTMEAVDALIN